LKVKITDINLGLTAASELLKVDRQNFNRVLISRVMVDKKQGGKDVEVPLNYDKAWYSRNSLSKALYSRIFSWLVSKINQKLNGNKDQKTIHVGVLDIYGFEVFKTNGFEQFCINYFNEKLHQLFLELTLKSEQEEYENENIKWEKIDFFNNITICELIDAVY
jgi:myosin-1